jgi:hypothetical protein
MVENAAFTQSLGRFYEVLLNGRHGDCGPAVDAKKRDRNPHPVWSQAFTK